MLPPVPMSRLGRRGLRDQQGMGLATVRKAHRPPSLAAAIKTEMQGKGLSVIR